MLDILFWTSTVFMISAYYFLNRKDIKGYYFFIIGNVPSIIASLLVENYAQLVMFSALTLFNIDGIIRWKRDKKK